MTRKAIQTIVFLSSLIIVSVHTLTRNTSPNYYKKYAGYKIYEIYFQHQNQSQRFVQYFQNFINDSSIITKRHERGHSLLMVIAAGDESSVIDYLQRNKINFKIINHNVGQSIKKQRRQATTTTKFYSTPDLIDFESYQRYDVINNYMEYLKEQYPKRVNIINIGKTYEGRDLKAILITNNTQRVIDEKPLILIDAGIHAREWISTATALYVMQQLVENGASYEEELNMYDWLIWPIVNPDGYEYSHDHDRLWRKNRRPSNLSTACVGADLNRNFAYQWSYSGVSTNPCSEIYAGAKAFSEPESQALRDLLLKVNKTCRFYLTLHAYGNYLLYPWGYENSLPSTWPYLKAVARAGARAIKNFSGSFYAVGGAGKTLYPASGGSDDYALAVAKIPVVLCMELPSGGNGFDPPLDKIQSIVEESWYGIRAMAMEVYEYPLRNGANYNTLSFIMILGVIYSFWF